MARPLLCRRTEVVNTQDAERYVHPDPAPDASGSAIRVILAFGPLPRCRPPSRSERGGQLRLSARRRGPGHADPARSRGTSSAAEEPAGAHRRPPVGAPRLARRGRARRRQPAAHRRRHRDRPGAPRRLARRRRPTQPARPRRGQRAAGGREDARGDELPRIDTPNATVYVQRPGTYRLERDQETWSARGARRQRRGGHRARLGRRCAPTRRPGSRASDARPRCESASAATPWSAGPPGSTRRPSARQPRRLRDPSLPGRLVAPLRQLAHVVEPPGLAAARRGGWRPYWHGRWAYTPSGLTWVSYEPWGWVPYHYGSWDFSPGLRLGVGARLRLGAGVGLLVLGPDATSAGARSATTPATTARAGTAVTVTGTTTPGASGGASTAGAAASLERLELRRPRPRLGRRDHTPTAVQLARKGELPRGIITTDTRGSRRTRWKGRAGHVGAANDRAAREAGRELPDVTPFVAREPN